MAIIAPFRGLTYNFEKLGDVSKLVAPPYDVISEDEQEEFYRLNPFNVIRLDLGKKKKGDSDWDNRYTRAASLFNKWQSDEILVRSDSLTMYLTSLEYDPGEGRDRRRRWGLISLVRIEDEGSGVILPHEKTFSAHKDDRMKLMRACNGQLSQVFGLFDDPEDRILTCLKSASGSQPRVSFDLKDGTSHSMWEVKDPNIFRIVAESMLPKKVYIADGHHRYETSRSYRDLMRVRYGRYPENKSFEFLIMYLANMRDEGLTVLPSHRLIKRCDGFTPGSFLDLLSRWFYISEISCSENERENRIDELKKRLEEEGRKDSAIGFYYHGSRFYYLLTLRPGAREEMGDEIHPSLKNLDVLVLSRLILRRGLGFKDEDLNNEEIFHYNSVMEKAISLVESGSYQMTFLLNHTKVSQVKEIADNSLIMPRKSTYFYPKVLTGLVFNRVDPDEIIQIP
ncbi:MAG: DUF1015 domain-containing protein [Deltaproteobacteria bacterium]|nr:DUF1015 domain-containing protein [Deltaproteobacteria bacterium]